MVRVVAGEMLGLLRGEALREDVRKVRVCIGELLDIILRVEDETEGRMDRSARRDARKTDGSSKFNGPGASSREGEQEGSDGGDGGDSSVGCCGICEMRVKRPAGLWPSKLGSRATCQAQWNNLSSTKNNVGVHQKQLLV